MQSIANFLSQFGINWIDAVIVAVCLFYAVEGYAMGFLASLFDLFSFVLSFIVGLRFYSLVGTLLVNHIVMPQGFANAAGFFITAFVSEIIFNVIFRVLLVRLMAVLGTFFALPLVNRLNHVLGILPGLTSALIILSFLLTLIISLPLSPFLKNTITQSTLAEGLVANTQGLEKGLDNVFGGAIKDTLTFLTIEPKSNESVSLHLKTTNVSVDHSAEQKMFAMVNKERTSRGIPTLSFNEQLATVGRAHCKDMFARGYFSHYTPEGLSPFDRMAKANITYTYAGENLALAPNTDLAMQGLMNSPGHRANILNVHFGKVGIGVIDGGIYGEMFCQEFTD